MTEYVFRGRLTLSGVDFFITARSEKEARLMAERGDFHHYETDRADTADVEINPESVELNE